MFKRPNESDTVTLPWEPISRTQQVLDAVRHQVRWGQHQTDDGRVEQAIAGAEDAVDTACAGIVGARKAEIEAGVAERKRDAWRPA